MSVRLLILLVGIFLFITPINSFAQECESSDTPYTQCGGTVGLEDTPPSHTVSVTKISNRCTGAIRYENKDLGEINLCPSVDCPVKVREYGQCGKTTGLENYSPNHTVRVWEIKDCNGKISYQNKDLGDKGECSENSATYSVAGSNGVTTRVIPQDASATNPTAPTAPTDPTELRNKLLQECRWEFMPNWQYEKLRWAWETCFKVKYYAPNFLPLQQKAFNKVTVINAPDTRADNARGQVIISNGSAGAENLFKQTLTHELGHIIHGYRGSPRGVIRPGGPSWDNELRRIKNSGEGYLTSYSQKLIGDESTHLDEDFAETVSYYVHRGMPEQNTAICCPATLSVNPLESGKYPEHQKFAQELLGTPATTPIQPSTSSNRFLLPAPGTITTCFTSAHIGYDIGNSTNTPIKAADNGVVIARDDVDRSNNGIFVSIKHSDGLITMYLHLAVKSIPDDIKVGSSVSKGQLLGTMDNTGKSTGPHLHFDVQKSPGQYINPGPYLGVNNCYEGLILK